MTDQIPPIHTVAIASITDCGPDFMLEVAGLIVQALNLEVAAEAIAPDASLYGEGLGLDSIDILEVALLVSKNYGIQLRADQEDNQKIFQSLRSLADYIAVHRTL